MIFKKYKEIVAKASGYVAEVQGRKGAANYMA